MHSVVLLTAIAASVVGTVAQNSTAHFNTTTSTPTTLSIGTASVTLFNGGEAAMSNIPGYQSRTDLYSADIVNADACGVTYAVAYPGADIGAQTVTIVEQPSRYSANLAVDTSGVKVTFTEECSIMGLTAAVCTASAGVTYKGHSTSTTSTISLSSPNSWSSTVIPLGSGGEKLSSTTGSCTTHGNAAVATGLAEVYKVIVVPAAAALLPFL